MPDARSLIGRQSSHYTRMVRITAHELGIGLPLAPVFDLLSQDPAAFGGNPALKLPVLRDGSEAVFGSLAACRHLHRLAGRPDAWRFPEHADSPLLLNAHELLAHAMATQVEVVFHEQVAQRPPDAPSLKRRASLLNCLGWLDAHGEAVVGALGPPQHSLFGIGLFCLLEHIPFRNPLDLSGLRWLEDYTRRFAERESARATPYRFDQR